MATTIKATKEEQKEFSLMIEVMAKERRITNMEAVLLHCELTGFEVELCATLITPALKQKIAEEAQAANMIKRNNSLYD
jgi:hypothetical protein